MHGNAKLPGTIGKKMQKYRKRAGLTQENLAEKVKVSGAYIGHIEQGRNAPSLELLERVSRVLRIPLKELF